MQCNAHVTLSHQEASGLIMFRCCGKGVKNHAGGPGSLQVKPTVDLGLCWRFASFFRVLWPGAVIFFGAEKFARLLLLRREPTPSNLLLLHHFPQASVLFLSRVSLAFFLFYSVYLVCNIFTQDARLALVQSCTFVFYRSAQSRAPFSECRNIANLSFFDSFPGLPPSPLARPSPELPFPPSLLAMSLPRLLRAKVRSRAPSSVLIWVPPTPLLPLWRARSLASLRTPRVSFWLANWLY